MRMHRLCCLQLSFTCCYQMKGQDYAMAAPNGMEQYFMFLDMLKADWKAFKLKRSSAGVYNMQ